MQLVVTALELQTLIIRLLHLSSSTLSPCSKWLVNKRRLAITWQNQVQAGIVVGRVDSEIGPQKRRTVWMPPPLGRRRLTDKTSEP